MRDDVLTASPPAAAPRAAYRGAAAQASAGKRATAEASGRGRDWKGFGAATAAVAAATAVGWPLHHTLALAESNILMLYLLGVLWIATRYSRAAAIFASVLGVVAFDLVFVPPYYTLTVQDEQYLITLACMLIAALTISGLTHRSRARAAEARAAWQRAELESLRNTILSGVSHDLRTPLAAITGASSTLIEGGASLSADARDEMLQTIYTEAERMERLINNLLELTRLESGGLVVKKEWQPLQEVVGSALHHLDRRLCGRAVSVDLPVDLPLVQMDAIAVEQVLVNLIENALEHTPPGTRIDITAKVHNRELIVEVADRGPGLPPGAEPRLFEKFFRTPSAGGRQRGLGLGLAISRGIIEAHGGSISARNRPGGGALFRFTLPAVSEAPRVDHSR